MAAGLKLGETVHWAEPGQWRSYCERIKPPLTPEQVAEIEQDDGDPETCATPAGAR